MRGCEVATLAGMADVDFLLCSCTTSLPSHPLLLHTILHAGTNIQATSVKPVEWSFLDCQPWNAIICRRVSNPNIDTCINESGRHAAQVPTMQLSKSDDTGEAPARGRVLLFARGRLVAAGLRGKQRRIICTRHGEAVRVVFPTPTCAAVGVREGPPTPTLVARTHLTISGSRR